MSASPTTPSGFRSFARPPPPTSVSSAMEASLTRLTWHPVRVDASAATEERFTEEEHAFLLSRVQPALIGLIDGSLSTLAPIFAVALGSEDPHLAFFAGLATAIGAAV